MDTNISLTATLQLQYLISFRLETVLASCTFRITIKDTVLPQVGDQGSYVSREIRGTVVCSASEEIRERLYPVK
jgi:hypothetical protein